MSDQRDPRVPNQWGFESFITEEAARAYVRRFQLTRAWGQDGKWRIWRLPDGTFDFTSSPSPRQHPAIQGAVELVGTQEPDAPRRNHA